MTVISPAHPGDAEDIAALTEEMDRFYGATGFEPHKIRMRQIHEALFADPPSAYAILARDGGRLTGLAAYSFIWPATGLTRSLFLKELYVAESARRAGVGRMLMNALFEIAAKQGCGRVEWMTDRENTAARRFYEALGVPPTTSKVFYRAGDGPFGLRPADG